MFLVCFSNILLRRNRTIVGILHGYALHMLCILMPLLAAGRFHSETQGDTFCGRPHAVTIHNLKYRRGRPLILDMASMQSSP